jgi:hypothetical protein
MGILDPNKLQVLRRLADMPQNLCNDTHFNNTLNLEKRASITRIPPKY